jgi:predicted lactoylglutathione lyase
MKLAINNLIAMAHVADVRRSADFYSQMGFRIGHFQE